MIEIKNACYSYGKASVLENINLSFEKGKLYSIIGPNGSGKTTLLNLLSRLEKPNSGEMLLDNIQYYDYKPKEFAKKVSLLPQEKSAPDMTVYDYISYGRYPYFDITRKLDEAGKKSVKNAMELTDTEVFVNRRMKELSGGERMRVYLAMILAQDTDYVLLDEPATYLDISSMFIILDLLKMLKESGKCVISVLHDLSTAIKYSDRMIVMEKGRVKDNGLPEYIASNGIIEEVFGVKCTEISVNSQREYIFDKPNK